MLDLLEKGANYMKNSPVRIKYLTLNDFSGIYVGKKFMKRVKELREEVYAKRMGKSAALGILGIKKVLLRGFNIFGLTDVRAFKTKRQALEYLTK